MNSIILYIFIFIMGLIVGSFLNVVIYRYLHGGSIIFARSNCPNCTTTLKIQDLIPLLSFLFLKGKCRYCGEKISMRYPLVELVTGVVFVSIFYYMSLGPYFWKYILLFSLLIIISTIDIKSNLIPNRFVLILFIWVLMWQLFFPKISPSSAVLGFLVGGLSFFLIAVLSRGGMGGGDVKLMAVLGLSSGWPYILIFFFLAFVLGAFAGVGFLVSKKKSRKDSMSFGPFLGLSFYLVTLWGQDIWHWYISFL